MIQHDNYQLINVTGSYPPFDDGIEMNCFIKNTTNQLFIGKVWNKSGKTVFPDFSHPNATKYWTKQFREFWSKVPIDGAWNDMNELSNSVPGALNGCPKNNSLEKPPYQPKDLSVMQLRTLCMTARHYAGIEYDLHNLYSFYESISTDMYVIRKS